MTQLSEAKVYAATKDPSGLPDFTATFYLKAPPDTPGFSVQFNLLGEKLFPQFVFKPRNNIMYNAGAGPVKIGGNYAGPGFLVSATGAPFVTDLDTGVPASKFLDGSVKVGLSLAAGKYTMFVVNTSDGAFLFSRQYSSPDIPYAFDCQVVGAAAGQNVDFKTFDGVLEYDSTRPIQGFMGVPGWVDGAPGQEFQWGTYSDPNLYGGNPQPLFWLDGTGESSNLYESVLSQDSMHVQLEYSLVQGNQTFANPQPPAPGVTLINASPARLGKLGDYEALVTSWANPTSSDVSGIVFVTLKNSFNQTVAVTTGSGIFPANSTTTVYNPLVELPPSGAYKASTFVVSVDGKPLTPSTDSTVVF